MDSQVEEVKARVNIVELIGGYVRLTKAGTHWKGLCPFHNEKTPSFTVNEERQMWHCFGCSKGGDIFAFLMEIEGLEFREALQLLAERTGVVLRPYRSRSDEANDFSGSSEPMVAHDGVAKARVFEALELATKFAEKQLWSPVGAKALEYLRNRGLTDESLKNFRVGLIPDGWRHTLDFLISRGYTEREIEAAGLIIVKDGKAYDRFRARIMFPIQDVLGRVIGFSARVCPGADESQAKYINTPETIVYHKSVALYGIALAKQAMKAEDHAIFVEGQMDVIAMHQAGFTQTVAVSGTALTEEQLKIIKRYTSSLRFFFDMDKAGQTAARRSTELALRSGLRVAIISIEGGKDAAELAQHDPDALRGAIHAAAPALEYFLRRLMVRYNRHSPDGRRDIVTDFATLISAIADVVERGFWLKRLAETVETDERIVAESVENVLRTQRPVTAPAAAGSLGIPAVPRSTPNALAHRSEVLRQRIGWCGLLEPTVFSVTVAELPTLVRDYLFEDPVLSLVQAGNASEEAARTQGQGDALREALFSAEAFLEREGLANLEAEERKSIIKTLFQQFVAELAKELQREQLRRIEYQMKQAREAGDKETEAALRAEFARAVSES